MDTKLKVGYWLYALSFVTPSFDLSLWGIQIATNCALSSVALLLSGFPELLYGLAMLSLFFLNFTVLPGIELHKGLRIATMILAGLAGILPQQGPEGETLFYVTVPPYLLWAASVLLINLLKIKEARSGQTVDTKAL